MLDRNQRRLNSSEHHGIELLLIQFEQVRGLETDGVSGP